MTDIVQLKNEKKRNIKPSLVSHNNMNDDKYIDDLDYEDGFAYEGEENLFSKGNKVKNRLFNGKFGKLYRSFNLQVLKHKMWDLLTHVSSNFYISYGTETNKILTIMILMVRFTFLTF